MRLVKHFSTQPRIKQFLPQQSHAPPSPGRIAQLHVTTVQLQLSHEFTEASMLRKILITPRFDHGALIFAQIRHREACIIKRTRISRVGVDRWIRRFSIPANHRFGAVRQQLQQLDQSRGIESRQFIGGLNGKPPGTILDACLLLLQLSDQTWIDGPILAPCETAFMPQSTNDLVG